jgi:hypothetical protein
MSAPASSGHGANLAGGRVGPVAYVKLRFCDSPYEMVVVTNDDSLWESRVKTNTCFELYAWYTLEPSWTPAP